MEAFLKYKHILMDKVDQEESCLSLTMAFITTGWFPFTWRIEGLTYQRLVHKMFKDQIGNNVKVYVDDMLVKSKIRRSNT